MKTVIPGLSRALIGRVILGAGMFVAIVAIAWLFAPGIREFLQASLVMAMDRQVAASLHAATNPALLRLMYWISFFHGTAGILAMTAIAAAVLWWHGDRRALPTLVLAVPGGMLLNVAVKHVVHRARPDWGYAQQALESFSFPSGHTAGSTLFYGVMVLWMWPRLPEAWMRLAALAAATSMVLLVAASRIVLGMHFLTDCIAAVLEALLWLSICSIGIFPLTERSTLMARKEP